MSIIYSTLERLETGSVSGETAPTQYSSSNRRGRAFVALALGLGAVISVAGYVGWQYLQGAAAGHVQVPPIAHVESGTGLDTIEAGAKLPLKAEAKPVPKENTRPSRQEGVTDTPTGYSIPEAARPAPSNSDVVAESKVSTEPERPESTSGTRGPANAEASAEVSVHKEAMLAAEERSPTDEDVSSAGSSRTVTKSGGEFSGTPLLSSSEQPDLIDTAVDEARQALAHGNYSQALAALESDADVPEYRADYWLVKGSAYLALGMLESAERCLNKAGSAAPGNPQVAVQLAIVIQERDDHAAALQILAEAAAENAHVPEIFLNMGYSQLAIGAESEAQRSFRTFMKLTRDRSRYRQQREALERWLQQAAVAAR
jgi:Flp pilus assembly protein TadD